MPMNGPPPNEPKPPYNTRNVSCVIDLAGHRPLVPLESIPDTHAAVPTEAQEMIALANWLRGRDCLWMHVPNEGKRSMATGALLKRMGLQAGVPDMLVFGSTAANPKMCGAAVEMKRRDGTEADVRQSQREWLSALQARGWFVHVAYGAKDAVDWLSRIGF